VLSRLTWILRHYSVLLVLLVIVSSAAWLFRETLLPFLVAIFIVYLMEPVVVRLSNLRVRKLQLSRLGAVAVVYTAVLAFVVVFAMLFVPRLIAELSTLANDSPRIIQQLREDRLPYVNRVVDRALRMVGGAAEIEDAGLEDARSSIHDAVARADSAAVSTVLLLSSEQYAALPVQPSHQSPVVGFTEATEPGEGSAMFQVRLRPDGSGFDLVASGGGLVVHREGEHSWRLQTAHEPAGPDVSQEFDLEEALSNSLSFSAETGDDRVEWVFELLQHLFERILEGVTTLFITLMVAAFIASDVPRFVAFFYSLIPLPHRPRAERLLFTLNEGLAGVIRGQVLICFVNGILTGVGLAMLGVKFSVLLAFIAGVLSLIPIFGTIISTIPAVAVGLTNGFMTALLVLAWILVIHFVEANLLNPKILGDSAKIHPVVIVFALLAGEHGFGLIGALLAVPTASIVQSLFLFLKEVLQEENSAAEQLTTTDLPQ
jgi:predicted PurR-regulated permease PerM